jgi:hypothetical protein
VRYIEENVDKRSLSDDSDHLKKLDPYLRSLKLDAIDMAALQPFIRDRKLKDGVSKATVNRALQVVRRILNVAHQDWRWLKVAALETTRDSTRAGASPSQVNASSGKFSINWCAIERPVGGIFSSAPRWGSTVKKGAAKYEAKHLDFVITDSPVCAIVGQNFQAR